MPAKRPADTSGAVGPRVQEFLDASPLGDPIRRRKISDEVLVRLLAEIRSGRIAPGDRLPSERALARTLKIGRLPVREAYNALQRMGMVELPPRRRARIVSPMAQRGGESGEEN